MKDNAISSKKDGNYYDDDCDDKDGDDGGDDYAITTIKYSTAYFLNG